MLTDGHIFLFKAIDIVPGARIMNEGSKDLIGLNFKDYTILIVDDNLTNSGMISNYLKEYKEFYGLIEEK
jgi:hypothetical protein